MVALAPIIVVFVALFALLVYYGAEWLGRIVVHFTPSIHIPGLGNLRDLVSVAVDGGIDVVRGLLKPVIEPITHLIMGAAVWAVKIIYGGLHLAESLTRTVFRLATIVIPAAVARAERLALAAIHSVARDLRAAIAATRASLWAGIHAVHRLAEHLVAAAISDLTHLIHATAADIRAALAATRSTLWDAINSLRHAVAADLDDLRGWTVDHIHGVEADLRAAEKTLEADIAAGVKAAIHAVDIDLVHPLEGVWDGTIRDIDALIDAIPGEFLGIGDLLSKLDLSRALDLAGVAGLSLVMSRVLARYLRECGAPNCRNLSGFGRFLEDLLAGLSVGALLELLREIVTDPEGAATSTLDNLGGFATSAFDDVTALLGV